MQSDGAPESYVRYGRSLANSGAAGMRRGREAYLNGKPLGAVLGQKARASLGLAAIGACAGLAQCFLSDRRRRVPVGLAIGAVGSIVGFFAGFTWKTRDRTSSMVHAASKNMSAVRDEHWLERHPIDYA
jgi:H+/Cl- antiporter ClcA